MSNEQQSTQPATAPALPDCVLPSPLMQKFLLDMIDQTNFPGKMSEFVSQVKVILSQAQVKT